MVLCLLEWFSYGFLINLGKFNHNDLSIFGILGSLLWFLSCPPLLYSLFHSVYFQRVSSPLSPHSHEYDLPHVTLWPLVILYASFYASLPSLSNIACSIRWPTLKNRSILVPTVSQGVTLHDVISDILCDVIQVLTIWNLGRLEPRWVSCGRSWDVSRKGCELNAKGTWTLFNKGS